MSVQEVTRIALRKHPVAMLPNTIQVRRAVMVWACPLAAVAPTCYLL
jgi:hypothetical protein